MIVVTKHAALRYTQRVMGLKDVKGLGEDQLSAVRAKINGFMIDKYKMVKNISSLESCVITAEGFDYVFENNTLVTVKVKDGEIQSHLKGGVMKSGKKVKKLMKGNRNA